MPHRIRGRAQPAVFPLHFFPQRRRTTGTVHPGLGPERIPRPRLRTRRAASARRQSPIPKPGETVSTEKRQLQRSFSLEDPAQWAQGCQNIWHQVNSDLRLASTYQPTLHYTRHSPRKHTQSLIHTPLHHSHAHSCTHLHPQQLTWVHAHDTLPQTNTGGYTARTSTTHLTHSCHGHTFSHCHSPPLTSCHRRLMHAITH